MQYKHLLVPLDFSPTVDSLLEAAMDLARQHQAHTTLLHVVEEIDLSDSSNDDENGVQDFLDQLVHDARAKMTSMMQRFQQAGLPVSAEVLIGHAPREIVQYSAREAIDLVVMQSERVDLRQPFQNVATTSHQVSLFCQCPVILLK